MKTIKIMIVVLSIITVAVFAQANTESKHCIHKNTSANTTYTCPMHPQIVMDKSGKCSICGMDLTKHD